VRRSREESDQNKKKSSVALSYRNMEEALRVSVRCPAGITVQRTVAKRRRNLSTSGFAKVGVLHVECCPSAPQGFTVTRLLLRDLRRAPVPQKNPDHSKKKASVALSYWKWRSKWPRGHVSKPATLCSESPPQRRRNLEHPLFRLLRWSHVEMPVLPGCMLIFGDALPGFLVPRTGPAEESGPQ
jgi:hypothetical protein